MAIVGGRPVIKSHSGFFILPKNWRAYEDNDSTYLRWPSAYSVSNARDDLPEPESPVITINLSLGMSNVTPFKLFTLAFCI